VAVVHQVLPSFAARDAIGIHALNVRRALRAAGHTSDIYAEHADAEAATLGPRPLSELPDGEGVWLIYQLSTGSWIGDQLVRGRHPLIVNYHNVTPAAFVFPWAPEVGLELQLGRDQVSRLAARARLGIGVSAYNERELWHAGVARTAVVPPLIDCASRARVADAATAAALSDLKRGGGTQWLFVGRLAPHKRQDLLIRAFAVYRAHFDPDARLQLVGGCSLPKYDAALRGFAGDLGLGAAVSFVGSLPDEELAAYYGAADVFVSASAHEGFSVPAVEAMSAGLPIVAVTAGALGETVGAGAIVLERHDPSTIAVAVDRVRSDAVLRDALAAAARARAADFALEGSTRRFIDEINSVVAA
jgi:glycosyltransferase involved in cell wall biosynthesis